MSELHKKKDRLEPLIRVRKRVLDHESSVLSGIRQDKAKIVEQLRVYQNQYVKGVEHLNHERQSTQHGMLLALEQSVDYAKHMWHESVKSLQTIEAQERAQIAQVLNAERRLKSLEKLDERYESNISAEVRKEEQKAIDASALQRHRNK